ncbi:MAG: plasmid partitioning protein RepB C-terminal domain-containing protein [Gemmataceae bacterium]
MSVKYQSRVQTIPVAQINVLNARSRGRAKFAQIVSNIAKLGLKRPVTVAVAEPKGDEPRFDLVCGQGRLEAYIELGQTEIPAIVIECSREDLMLMSLAENLARRKHSTVELVRDVRSLKERGYSLAEIARKIDLETTYVRGILQLLDRGEERLLQAVEKGHLPVSIAVIIATADDKAVQRALQEAYERNDLRGKSLLRARRLIEQRRARGKRPRGGPRRNNDPVSAETLLRTFQQETARQRMVIQKAKIVETRLLFAVSALKRLFQDDHFLTLLRAEGLDSLPQYLAERVHKQENVA